ncbi:MAG: FKBP-type peptidyl-prolyl cis-trans isomerase [Treponema sp.]|jgi:FKBP-type peptidyl-prolyl cis-trans isomerase|nr:FKBP-type peptidyl-prolyl cis-trans isomerase [Treponema sp.]
MKKHFILICLFLSVLTLHAKAIQEDLREADEKARVSYAFGMYYGSNLSTMPLEFDYNAFAEGFKVMMEDLEPQLSEQEAIEIIETALNNAREKTAAESRQREAEFLTINSRRPEVHVTPSGLQYEILIEAEGEKPASDSIVHVHYVGALTDGSLFDRSAENEGAYIPLQMVIPGWSEGLTLMGIGSTYRFYIPSNLAYGRDGIQNVIPQYATLVFTVDLLDILSFDDSGYDFEQDF